MSYRNVLQNNNTLNQLPMYSYGGGRFNTDNLSSFYRPYEQSQLPSDPTMFPQSLPMDPNMQHALRMQGVDRGNIDYSLTNRITDGLGNFKDTITDKITGFRDSIGGGLRNILDNTIMGRISAGFDATNPRADNYNPNLQGQIDFMKDQGMYGINQASSLPQITGGVLAGKNLQSMIGSNDLMAMYDKELAKAMGVLEGLPEQWSNLEEDDPEYQKKLTFHQNRVAKIKAEKAEAAKAAKAQAEAAAAQEQAQVQSYNMSQRGGGAGDSSRSHMGGISQAQADAVGAANKAAGMTGWGLKEGGLVSIL